MKAAISILLVLTALAAQSSDQELLERAMTLWDQGQYKEALKSCKDLIKNYPTSKYVPDAYLMFGEFYFEHAKIEKALMAYKRVVEFKDSKVYTYAMYKMGWCYFNIMEYDRALAEFVAVVRQCDKQQRETGQESKLRREALNDVALVFSHAKKANTAPAFFKRLAPKEAGSLLVKLGGIYYGDGKFKDAVLIYHHLLSKEQCSPRELVYQQKIVDCTVRLGNKSLTVKEVGRLVVLFGQVNTCLRNPTTRQQETLDQARQESEQTLHTLAITFHREAQNPEAIRLSRKLAEYYLELFPHSPRAEMIRGLLR
jgi:tetratricopeptide (TPR) repeat protein